MIFFCKIYMLCKKCFFYHTTTRDIVCVQGQEVKVVVISTVLSEWVDRYETKVRVSMMAAAFPIIIYDLCYLVLCIE